MKIKLTFLLIIFAHLTLFAQKGSVRGFVYDKENGEPIMFCNVIIEGRSIGASTDVNGFFNITNVPVGNHTLFVTYIGYDTLRQEITLKDKQISLILRTANPYMIASSGTECLGETNTY